MQLKHLKKAIAAGLSGSVVGVGGAIVALPPDTPWWGYIVATLASAAITYAGVYLAPANQPKEKT